MVFVMELFAVQFGNNWMEKYLWQPKINRTRLQGPASLALAILEKTLPFLKMNSGV